VSTSKSPSVMRTKLARISKASYAVLYARAQANNTSIEVEIDRLVGLDEQKQLEFIVTPTALIPPTKPEVTQP
jgi:hypothetical protein